MNTTFFDAAFAVNLNRRVPVDSGVVAELTVDIPFPHAHTAPSDFSATVCQSPAAMESKSHCAKHTPTSISITSAKIIALHISNLLFYGFDSLSHNSKNLHSRHPHPTIPPISCAVILNIVQFP